MWLYLSCFPFIQCNWHENGSQACKTQLSWMSQSSLSEVSQQNLCVLFLSCLRDEPELDGIFILHTSSVLEDKRSFQAFHANTHTHTQEKHQWLMTTNCGQISSITQFLHISSLSLPLTHSWSHEYSFVSLPKPKDERWGSNCDTFRQTPTDTHRALQYLLWLFSTPQIRVFD